MKVKKMLVPVDFSETSKRALQAAVDLAEALRTESITVLHVAMRPTDYLPLDDWIFGKHQPPKDVEGKVTQSARKSLEKLLERHDAAPVDLAARVEFGPASATILEISKQEGVDQSGFRVVINNGPDGGEEVPHLHIHLMGGRALRGMG